MLLKRSEFKSWLLSLEKDVVVGVFVKGEDHDVHVHPFAIYLQKISGHEDWGIGGNFYYLYHDGFECNKEIMESWATLFTTLVVAKQYEGRNVILVSAVEALKILDEVDQFLLDNKMS